MIFKYWKNFKIIFISVAVTNLLFIFIFIIAAILLFRYTAYHEEVMLTSIANIESRLLSDTVFTKYPNLKKELDPAILNAYASLLTFGDTGDSVIVLCNVDSHKFLWSARDGNIFDKGYLDLDTVFHGSGIRAFFLGYSSIMLGFDHRNVCVLSTESHIDGTNLSLIVKVDIREFLSPYIDLLISAIVSGIALMTLASIFLFYIISKPLRAKIKADAIALKKSQDDLKIKESIIFALTILSSYRDNETAAHIYRTRDYATVLAKALGMDANFINNLYKVSCLHDMGKVAVPDAILLKQEPLTQEEFGKMKYHTLAAKEILGEIIEKYKLSKEELLMAENVACYHHEKWNGTGYPQGLKGEEIPIEARIFAVADVYDALTSKRPYKQAFSHDLAIKILFTGDDRTKPSDFDLRVLEALKQQEEKFKKIQTFYNDHPDQVSYLFSFENNDILL